ncbi:MAG: hypothetical protein RLZZ502_793 [Pseudomonadota bacterium]
MSVNLSVNLSGKKILITGGARGLGACFARSAVAAGAQVVLADIAHSAEGQALAEEIKAHFVSMDVANRASVAEGVAQSVALLGGLDGLVNNAAVTNSGGKKHDEISDATWDQVMAVNVRGTWLATQYAVPHLRQSPCARIVNIASDTAMWGAPKLLAYVASKGAVMSMTHSLARELGELGITVNAVAPGLVLSESTAYVPATRHEHYLSGRAIQRPQLPEDVAGAVMFLLSEASAFITGQVLPVNGGFCMR